MDIAVNADVANNVVAIKIYKIYEFIFMKKT
jgi:hypothetical protein